MPAGGLTTSSCLVALPMSHARAGPLDPVACIDPAGLVPLPRGRRMAWRLKLLAAAEADPERRAHLLVVADELRELLDALGWPVDVAALVADLELEPE